MSDQLYATSTDPDVREALVSVGTPQFQGMASPAEDLFARLCVTTPDLADAYITAGYEAGRNRGQTLVRASRLRAAPNIEERVRHYTAVQRARMDVREDRILAELAAVGLSDPLDFFHPDGTPRQLDQIPAHARAAIREVSITQTQTVDPEGNVSTRGLHQYKLADKIKALDLLCRVKGLMVAPELTQRPVVVIDMSKPDGRTSDHGETDATTRESPGQTPTIQDLIG